MAAAAEEATVATYRMEESSDVPGVKTRVFACQRTVPGTVPTPCNEKARVVDIRSMGWLKVIRTLLLGEAYCAPFLGVTSTTAGLADLKDQRKSERSESPQASCTVPRKRMEY
ncbi:MAG: hypothetical protein NVS2B16_26210 [Chloroflexota bacterium]